MTITTWVIITLLVTACVFEFIMWRSYKKMFKDGGR